MSAFQSALKPKSHSCLVLDTDSPRIEEEKVSRLFQESLDIQGHSSRYDHHSDRKAFLETQATGHGSQQHALKLKLLPNVFCKRNCSRLFSAGSCFEARLRLWWVRCDQAASHSQTETRRGVSPVRGRTPLRTPATVCRALAALQGEYCHHCHTLPLPLSTRVPAPYPASRRGQLMPAWVAGPVQAVSASEARYHNK